MCVCVSVCHVLSLACGQRHASLGGFSYAGHGEACVSSRGGGGQRVRVAEGGAKGGMGDASETGSKIPTCALLFHQLFVSVLCEWTSTRIQKQQQQQEAGTHTHKHTLHTFHAHTHTLCNTHLDKLELDVLGILFWVCRLRDRSETHI